MTVMEKEPTVDRNTPTVERGADVARDLGWPADRVGLLGGFAGLLDLGAPYWKHHSSLSRMRRQRVDTTTRVLRRMRRATQRFPPR
jgi:hypothetical protein